MLQVSNLIGFGSGGYKTIQYVGSATDSKASSSTSTIALNSGLTGGIASAVSAGDLVIGVFSVGSTSDLTLSITDGTNPYTLIGSELYSSSTYDGNLRVAYKFMGSTPDTSITFGGTGGTANGGAMIAYVFRNVDQSNPLDVAAVTATGVASEKPNPPAITPVTPGAFIVAAGGHGHQSAGATYITPTDLTGFRVDVFNSTNDGTGAIGHKNDWVSGSFDPQEWDPDLGWTNCGWCAITFALRPASL
jgi:hypothetical protein